MIGRLHTPKFNCEQCPAADNIPAAPLSVAANSNVFLPGRGASVCAEHGVRAGPSGGRRGVQNVDGSTDAAGLPQTAGTGRIEDFDHNDRFQSVRLYKVKR